MVVAQQLVEEIQGLRADEVLVLAVDEPLPPLTRVSGMKTGIRDHASRKDSTGEAKKTVWTLTSPECHWNEVPAQCCTCRCSRTDLLSRELWLFSPTARSQTRNEMVSSSFTAAGNITGGVLLLQKLQWRIGWNVSCHTSSNCLSFPLTAQQIRAETVTKVCINVAPLNQKYECQF